MRSFIGEFVIRGALVIPSFITQLEAPSTQLIVNARELHTTVKGQSFSIDNHEVAAPHTRTCHIRQPYFTTQN
mgnify:CR=1 FL=1